MSIRRSSPDLIQQQIYTRERSGIFRSTEGFDTVAVSDGLDAVFIKKQLHPFCGYDAPAELVSRGEKDDASFPPALHLFHAENGDTVLGRSIHQSADFTGLRSAFLTHNYVIPAARQDEIVTHYREYLEAAFAEMYVPEIGRQLPELEDIPQNPRYAQMGLPRLMAEKLLHELKLDEKTFKQLLFAVMTAVGEGRKKVYVALDVPAEQIPASASALLQVLFACLPFELRRRLGFITYAKEPKSRKFIHLQFVERGSIRPNDREIEKDYVFDLSIGRVPQDELDEGRQPYLDMVWRSIGDLERLEEFHRFADEMLAGMDSQRRTLLSSYHELSVFYQIEAGDWDLYEAHKVTVLRGLLNYLEPAGALDSRIRLNDIFLAAFDREFDAVKLRNMAELSVVECFRDYYQLDSRSYGIKLINYLIHAINNALAGGKVELARPLYSLVESQPELSRAFFDLVMKHNELEHALFDPFIQNKFTEASGAREVLNVVHSWAITHPDVLRNTAFKEYAVASLKDKLRKEQQLLPAVHMVLDNVRKWGRTPVGDRGMTLADSELAGDIALAAKRVLLDELKLDKLTFEQITTADFLARPDAFEGLLLEDKQRRHVDMLQALYEWFAQREVTEDIFNGLPSADVKQMQQLGREWLQSMVELTQFCKIILAFYTPKNGNMDYAALLNYLQQHAKSPEVIYEFILWSQGQELFANSRGIAPAYTAALLNYFKKHDPNAFKSRDYRTRYFDKAGAPMAAVFAKIRLELSSPLKRFLAKNGKKVRVTALVLVASLVVLTGILVMQQQGLLGGSKPSVEATPPLNAEVEPNVLVYAENVTGLDGAETTSLVFQFAEAQKCKAFAPSALEIESPDQAVQQFANLKFTASCADDVDGIGGSGGDSSGDGVDHPGDPGSSNNPSDGAGAGGAAGEMSGENSDKSQAGDKVPAGGQAAGLDKGEKGSAGNGSDGVASKDTDGADTDGIEAPKGTVAKQDTGTEKGTKAEKGAEAEKGTKAGNGADKSGSATKDTAGNAASDNESDGASDKTAVNGVDSAEAKDKNGAGIDNNGQKPVYANRVTVSLGQKAIVPVGSVVKVGDHLYTVVAREEAFVKESLTEQPGA
ncbi:glycosyltransferase [Paenibacillus aceti]|uniref:Glycosyltransferase n=1 Tax=Paenibacillus aceti TaxID=1820010 RepID=A0ABQ1VR69_9BACL|nr:glycosyltransferase [Paenibacillus aceti]GGF90091.1 hypothetical protein GCM10010913_09410 [Paenibacillus aceti]